MTRGGKSALIEVTQGNEDSTIFWYFTKKVAKHRGKWTWESKDNNMKRLLYTVAQKSRLNKMVKVTEEEYETPAQGWMNISCYVPNGEKRKQCCEVGRVLQALPCSVQWFMSTLRQQNVETRSEHILRWTQDFMDSWWIAPVLPFHHFVRWEGRTDKERQGVFSRVSAKDYTIKRKTEMS